MDTNTQASAGKKRTLVVVSLVAIAGALFSLIPEKAPTPEAVSDRVNRFAYAAGVGMGRHLASAFPQARVRVLLSPQADTVMPSGPVAEGLEAALREDASALERVWVTGGVVPSAGSMEAVSEGAVSEGAALEEAIGTWENETDLMVLLFEPPPGLLRAREDRPNDKPALAVICPNVHLLIDSVEKGVISAVLAPRPDAQIYDRGRIIEPPEDPKVAFALGFEVLTPQNVASFQERYPQFDVAGHPEPGDSTPPERDGPE